jgi:hypothetical protein
LKKKEEEPSEQLNIGPNAQIGFTESGEGGQRHHRIRPNVTRLQVEVIEELLQEVARGQHEARPEVLKEDNCLTQLWHGHPLALGWATPYKLL